MFLCYSLRHFFVSSSRSLNIFIVGTLKSLSCASAKLLFSANFTIEIVAFGEGILSWLFILVFLGWDLDIWSYNVFGVSWSRYLVFP